MSLPGVYIAPEIQPATEKLFGSVDCYAEQYKAVLLQRRDMLYSANKLLNHKLQLNEEGPILPLDELVGLIRSGGLRYDLRTREELA